MIIAGIGILSPKEKQTSFAFADAPDNFVATAAAPIRQMAARWQPLLKDCTDIHSSRLTHWLGQTHSASRLDRIYFSSPGWLFLNVSV